MFNDIQKLGVPELARITVQKTERAAKAARKKSKPGEAPRAWLDRQHRALDRILSAVSKGAKEAGKKASDEVANYRVWSWWDTSERACRAREDVVYFEILDTVGRAAEAAAARAAGYKTSGRIRSGPDARSGANTKYRRLV